jgi:6-phosphofructokinase 1
MAKFLKIKHMDIIYVIGGDGSMKAAHVLSNYALRENLDISIIGIPKTMDNDILWVWQSFGFASSIEWAKGAVRQINTEVASNPRLCIVQLFGSDSGFVATHTALASGVCDLVLIPEVPFKSEVVVDYLINKLEERYRPGENGRSPYGIILLAETALPMDALGPKILNDSGLSSKEKGEIKNHFDNGCRIKGQTTDELRSAGLKILSSSIKKALRGKYWKQFRVLTIEPKQLIRSVPPSTLDIILGERLGSLAVDGAMAGYHDFMISQWLTEFVMVPLDLVVLGRKRIPSHGFLWKSVISTTGQPYDLTR